MASPKGKDSDLRNRSTFPSFAEVPHEDLPLLEPQYYSRDGATLYPRRHWCFLGEIVDFQYVIRMIIDVRDVSGSIVRIYCHDNTRGLRLEQMCKKGHTVAILYAEVHNFMDGTQGFRVEEGTPIKILPFSLEQLMLANENVHAPLTSCHINGCQRTEDKSTCSRCRTVVYCSVEHQMQDWPMHKKICKAAAAVRWFSERDWATFARVPGRPRSGFWDFDSGNIKDEALRPYIDF